MLHWLTQNEKKFSSIILYIVNIAFVVKGNLFPQIEVDKSNRMEFGIPIDKDDKNSVKFVSKRLLITLPKITVSYQK